MESQESENVISRRLCGAQHRVRWQPDLIFSNIHTNLTRFTSLLVLALGIFSFTAVAVCEARLQGPPAEPQSHKVDFLRDIQPIFSSRCYECHGSEKQKGKLRLDSKQSAFKNGSLGPIIVPGKADESHLYFRVAGLQDLEQMPVGGPKLSTEQISLIGDWINQGAEWPEQADSRQAADGRRQDVGARISDHWAYKKPVHYSPPAVKNSAWVRNAIDNFTLAKMEAQGLHPSPEASREILIRRLSLDLIGLPPTPKEVDVFVSDKSPDAYEKLVDRLLASPHYGERWARPWLDVARYADTHGYEKDMRRRIWPFRDWVIQAFNKDMPFDQFTVEQIAGDLLPNATPEQKVATGFHRNTMINEEGGVDPEEYRVAAVIDRVDTTASVWLGTTLACARCHNHKYDPFTQEEYYKFFAFFNNTEDEVEIFQRTERRASGPTVTLSSPAYLSSHRKKLENEIVHLQQILNTETPALQEAQAKWERDMMAARVPWTVLEPDAFASAAGATLTKLKDKSILAGGKDPEKDTYIVTAVTDLKGITAVRLETLADPTLPHGASGRASSGGFVLTGFEVDAAPASNSSQDNAVVFSDAVADCTRKGSSVKDVLSGDPGRGWSVDPASDESPSDHQAIFVLKEPAGFQQGTRLTIRLKQESQSPHSLVGRFRLAVATAKDPSRSVVLPVKLESILAGPAAQRTVEQKKVLAEYYRSVAPSLQPTRSRLAQARDMWKELSSPSTLVMKERAEPRPTHVMIRGNFLDKGKEVTPGVPAVLHSLPQGERANRLTLARWLVDKNNPLVARVTVDRFWMQFFGRGLVDTPEDFGTRGDPPIHPELLDWLATEFMQRNWSMKAMHRLIVTSATYRQSSKITPDLLERDPYNKLLVRGPRFRMEAEMIRDNALAIGGLLSEKMYGPSVFPPQPEGTWNVVYNDDKWQTSEGEDRNRRGIYTFWRRTAPYPSFVTFDAPSRESTCPARVHTATPLQSLTTLNDPSFFDAARGLANRIIRSAGPSSVARRPSSVAVSIQRVSIGAATVRERSSPDGAASEVEQRISYAFRLCVARQPNEKELERLVSYFNQELRHFQQDLSAAKLIANGGDVKPAGSINISEFAAWTMLSNVLLNLDETVTKE